MGRGYHHRYGCLNRRKPLLAFAVCYVTAHLALDLVDENQAEAILNYCEERLEDES